MSSNSKQKKALLLHKYCGLKSRVKPASGNTCIVFCAFRPTHIFARGSLLHGNDYISAWPLPAHATRNTFCRFTFFSAFACFLVWERFSSHQVFCVGSFIPSRPLLTGASRCRCISKLPLSHKLLTSLRNNNNNNNNVHLSCAHQRPERSHDTY